MTPALYHQAKADVGALMVSTWNHAADGINDAIRLLLSIALLATIAVALGLSLLEGRCARSS